MSLSGYGAEQWLKDDPSKDREKVRFACGSRVLYKIHDIGWVEGEVLKVHQLFEVPGECRIEIVYVVWPHDRDLPEENSGCNLIFFDDDAFIRLRPRDATPDPKKFDPFQVAPCDPLEYLYTGSRFHPYLLDNYKNTMEGDTLVEIMGDKVTEYPVKIPRIPLFGVSVDDIMQFGRKLGERREKTTLMIDPVKAFKAFVPKESTFAELEEASKHSNRKMLQLGDVLATGVRGWPKTKVYGRAYICYEAAAWGCQESEAIGRRGIPLGEPEAMVAAADAAFTYLKEALDLKDASLEHVLKLGLEHMREFVLRMFFWIASSLQIGHISLFALPFAQAVITMGLRDDPRIPVDSYHKKILDTLLSVGEYISLEKTYSMLMKQGRVPRGDPDKPVLELFARKVDGIYLDMPVSSDVIHVEYRQVPRARYPFVVFAVYPHRRDVLKVVHLPEHLQYAAFSYESFEYVWIRIAFELHLGKFETRDRARPSVFTVLDSRGNAEFAEYLSHKIRGSGTEVQLVSHLHPLQQVLNRKKRQRGQTLGAALKHIENHLLEIPNYLIDERSANSGSTLAGEIDRFGHQITQEVLAHCEDNGGDAVLEAFAFHKHGSLLFKSYDFEGAFKCFTIAIELLRHEPRSIRRSNALLGASLSNRAICALKMETKQSSMEFQILFLRRAIRDRTVLLKSSWVISGGFDKLFLLREKCMQDKAIARLDVLELSFRSKVDSNIYPAQSSSQRTMEGQVDPAIVQSGYLEPPPSDRMGSQSESMTNLVLDSGESTLGKYTDNLLLETGKTIYENNLAKNWKDGCPICLREFDGELSHILSTVLPCGEHALCVECVCRTKKLSDTEKQALQCPLCRIEVGGDIVQALASQIIEQHVELVGVLNKLPADLEESVELARRLLWKWDFNLDQVINTLEGILDDGASAVLFRTTVDLSHEQKQEIFQRARFPVSCLLEKQKQLVEERRTTFETSRLRSIDLELHTLRQDLAAARARARDEIYEKLNSVGHMGAQNTELHDMIQVDFHGLHVEEMHCKYKELVEAILPVVKEVTVITGRGLHSANGESKLMKALKKRIAKDSNTRWTKIPQNPGALVVSWAKDNVFSSNWFF